MLKITIAAEEFYDETTEKFSSVGGIDLELEHSLISLSKWESEFEKPFLTAGTKTNEEVLSYVKMMILTSDFPPEIVSRFTSDDLEKVNAYIDSKQSATTFNNTLQSRGRGETITAELIYYWMVTFNIPFECELWHLNRLFALIRICNLKNSKPKKMSKSEIAARNRQLNAERRQQLGTTG